MTNLILGWVTWIATFIAAGFGWYNWQEQKKLKGTIDFLIRQLNNIADLTVKTDSKTQEKLSNRYEQLLSGIGSIYADCIMYLKMKSFIQGPANSLKRKPGNHAK